MDYPTHIGLMGYARSGKSTVAQYLRDQHGYREIGFADPLREMALTLDPIVSVEPWIADTLTDAECTCAPAAGNNPVIECRGGCDADAPTHGADVFTLREVVEGIGWERAKDGVPEVRRILQRLGTECVRDMIGPRTWVDITSRRISQTYAAMVVPDVRFPNEVECLRTFGFRLVWVDRPGVAAESGHPSETSVGPNNADDVILNDGTREDLHARVRALI